MNSDNNNHMNSDNNNNNHQLKEHIYSPPTIGCHYSELPFPLAHDLVGHFIGTDGRVFKAINKRFKKQGCLYLWFNNEKNCTEIYSKSHQNSMDVRQALLERHDHIKALFSY